MSSDEPRNLLKGWCPQGEVWSTAVARIDPQEWERIKDTFDPKKPSEMTAALLAYVYSGLIPSNQDDQAGQGNGRDGAVDILLTDAITGERQVMEVTTSLDRRYQNSSAALSKFEEAVTRAYTGDGSWSLELQRDWESLRLVKDVAPTVAEALNTMSVNDADRGGPHSLHSHVIAWPADTASEPQVKVRSRNAGALNRDEPYLNALTDYLATDTTISGKLQKLKREATHFEATRTHLFIGMASTGTRGGLLPTSPSYMTWGEFTAPEPLTDLWLEGNTGEMYRWTREDGWMFYDLQK